MKHVIVTTSWDDGHKLDLRLADLLKKYGIAGTFYIAPRNLETALPNRLSDSEIKELGKAFEIGSHTMTHPVLTRLSPEACQQEIIESKNYLEKLLGKKVSSFCYPRGAYNRGVRELVKQAGHTYARTTEDYVFDLQNNLLTTGTSLDAYRLPLPRLPSALLKVARYSRWRPLLILKNIRWDRRAKTMFDKVLKEGGVFHLWGHSWAIEKAKDWQRLETVLAYIHGHKAVLYLTNAELAEHKGSNQ